MTVRIGLTGPIGCGKSTVAGWLRDVGATVIDADDVARKAVEPGEPALDAIFHAFGRGVQAPDGSLDRAALGRMVFADADALARLEGITRPAVRPRILSGIDAAVAAGVPAVVVEAIKLVEGGLATACDEVWLVTCVEATQRARLVARGMSEVDADARILAQAGIRDRLRGAATRVIDTDGDPDGTRIRVLVAYDEALTGPEG